jgi:hypothetical protein
MVEQAMALNQLWGTLSSSVQVSPPLELAMIHPDPER